MQCYRVGRSLNAAAETLMYDFYILETLKDANRLATVVIGKANKVITFFYDFSPHA